MFESCALFGGDEPNPLRVPVRDVSREALGAASVVDAIADPDAEATSGLRKFSPR